MSKGKIYEALLVLSTALLVIYLLGVRKNGEANLWFIYSACGLGISGIFIRPLGRFIALGWYKLADLLNFVMSKVIMSVVYIVILVPIATIYKLVKKDKLLLKRSTNSKWVNRNFQYSDKDLTNIW